MLITQNVRFVTDNASAIAFDLPELMGCVTWQVDRVGWGALVALLFLVYSGRNVHSRGVAEAGDR